VITYFLKEFLQKILKMDAESRCSLVSDSAGNRIFQHKEIYGKTKMTGNLGDAIAYGKLAVFPKIIHQNWSLSFLKKKIFLNS
jgi:hypothetical protein